MESPTFAQCVPLSAQICVSGNYITQIWVNGSFVGSMDYCATADGCDSSHLCLPVPLKVFQGTRVCLALETSNLNPPVVYSSWELEVNCQGGKSFIVNNEESVKAPPALYWDPTGGPNCGAGAPPLSDSQGHNWMDPQYNPASNPFTLTAAIVAADTETAVHIKSDMPGATLPFVSHNTEASGAGPYQGCEASFTGDRSLPLPGMVSTDTPVVFLTPTPSFTPRPPLRRRLRQNPGRPPPPPKLGPIF